MRWVYVRGVKDAITVDVGRDVCSRCWTDADGRSEKKMVVRKEEFNNGNIPATPFQI
jgi:hypothetical protein